MLRIPEVDRETTSREEKDFKGEDGLSAQGVIDI